MHILDASHSSKYKKKNNNNWKKQWVWAKEKGVGGLGFKSDKE